MEYWQVLLLFVVGIAAGWINVMAGGGSLLSIPALLFMDIPAPIANGTNRIAILAQNITAFITFYRNAGFNDFKLSLSLSLFASLGAIVGAMLGVHLDGEWFNRVLAIVMILVMIFMFSDTKNTPSDNAGKEPKNLLLGHFLMIFAGFWGGLIHVGVGFVLMPILYRVMGFNLLYVNMYKISIALFFTITALIVFSSQLELVWWAGLSLAVGNSIGGWLGAHTSIHKGDKWIKNILYAAISVFIIKLLFF